MANRDRYHIDHTYAENIKDMHQEIQDNQECQSLHSRFDHPSPKPPQAAHLAIKVPTATTSQ
eukprot:2833892-Prorocentrum_lima.AAC.1